MKSIYQDAEFAEYWNQRAGPVGEPYKRHVLDPLMMELSADLKGRDVLELGCGNGYLAPVFIDADVKSLCLMDVSAHNLRYAHEKAADRRLALLEHDATTPWPLATASLDLIYSTMMLNEVEDITTPIQEAFRTLRPGGRFVLSVTHPAWDLFVYAQQSIGGENQKIKNLGGYFRRGYAKYIMSRKRADYPGVSIDDARDFEVEHYQRPVSDYFSALRQASFRIADLREPELSEALLAEHPRFREYVDNPIGLVFLAIKPEQGQRGNVAKS